jgi:excisionase family DNA binding protein
MARHSNPGRVKIHYSYTVEEAARVLGRHKNTVRSWINGGLPVVSDRRPVLILGRALRDFLSAQRSRLRKKCANGELYCLSCRSPKEPAERRDSALTAKTGNLRGLCPDCERLIHRVVSLAKIDAVRGKLEVTFPQAVERLSDTSSPPAHCDFKRQV